MKTLLIIIGVSLLCSCARQPIIYHPPCKDAPKLLEVKVIGNCICGEELKKLRINHINTWEYIEYLRILGGCK